MKFSIISSLDYQQGNILLICSRFANINTDNASFPPSLVERCFQFASSISDEGVINALVIVDGVDDGSVGIVDNVDDINVTRGAIEDLSTLEYIQGFDAVLFFGIDNNLSPLIRANILSFVGGGGGLILSDINLDGEELSLFTGIASVTVTSPGFYESKGSQVWTEDGVSNFIYSDDVANLHITPLNTISELNLSSEWSLLYIHDTEYTLEEESPIDLTIDETINSSSDYDIDGVNFVGYFATVYENGIVEVQ
jgi:hypothetical protein